MSKEIFLIRHARAELGEIDGKDIDRILTDEGCADAMRMGKKFQDEGHSPDVVLASTAQRTRETANYICEQVAFETSQIEFTDDLYESSVRILLGVINQLSDHSNKVWIIAHNPSISYLGEYLTGEIVNSLPPCGVLHLSTIANSWSELSQNSCTLEKYYDPIKL